MLATQSEIRSRIDQLRLSISGYDRQMNRLEMAHERRNRMAIEVASLSEEISALERLAQLGRIQPDRRRVEETVRAWLAELGIGTSGDNPFQTAPENAGSPGLSPEGRALLWAIGCDPLTLAMHELVQGREKSDSGRTDRAVSAILIHTLEDGPNVDARASAAFDIGRLQIKEGIGALIAARVDDPLVASIALASLQKFSDGDLLAAGAETTLIANLRAES